MLALLEPLLLNAHNSEVFRTLDGMSALSTLLLAQRLPSDLDENGQDHQLTAESTARAGLLSLVGVERRHWLEAGGQIKIWNYYDVLRRTIASYLRDEAGVADFLRL